MAARTVGFIGAGGIMGRGMALNLLKAGNKMVMWNRSVGKLDEFRENESVTIATSPMEVSAMEKL